MDYNKVRDFLLSFSTEKGYAVGMAIIALVIFVIAVYYANNVVLFLVTSAIGVYAFSISAKMYSYDVSKQDVMPDKDRDLLVYLIRNNDSQGLDMYIKLASLYGVTGNITKLGLTGLPLLTVALTILFTVLAAVLWSLKTASNSPDLIANVMDLAKLTLGAFIGSFVQRAVSERASEARPQSPLPSPAPARVASIVEAQDVA